MDNRISLKARNRVTHDTDHYVFTRPKGYDFTLGQATALTLLRKGGRTRIAPSPSPRSRRMKISNSSSNPIRTITA